ERLVKTSVVRAVAGWDAQNARCGGFVGGEAFRIFPSLPRRIETTAPIELVYKRFTYTPAVVSIRRGNDGKMRKASPPTQPPDPYP
ncbi:MAG: hypothetical protein ACYDCO_28405, partial [Armatimonadota bacterium]